MSGNEAWMVGFVSLPLAPREAEEITQWIFHLVVFSGEGIRTEQIECSLIKTDLHLPTCKNTPLTNLKSFVSSQILQSSVSLSRVESGHFALAPELQRGT